jgi:predicted pyridoxine 5'-phosphate oxidase superfamily flavin-nucleotide-binding protein
MGRVLSAIMAAELIRLAGMAAGQNGSGGGVTSSGQLIQVDFPGSSGPPGGDAGRHGSAGERRLQERYGTGERAGRFYDQQVLDHLNDKMREFLARQEMMFVASSDGRGECDCTFRAGPPGFVRVLDESRLAWPEYRGNGVLASLGNISENPNVGLLFVDFFRDVIGLHVNGRATIVEDPAMRTAYRDLPVDPVPGRRPERWVTVCVEEAYIHCGKHIPRLLKLPRDRAWGTDDAKRKGADFFGAAGTPRHWAGPESPVPISPVPIDPEPRHPA